MSTVAANSYRLASGDTLTNLEKAVNQALPAGWQPWGPPFLTHDHRIVQALVLPAGVAAKPGASPVSESANALGGPQGQAPQSAPRPSPVQQPAPAPPQPQPAAAQPQPQPAPQAPPARAAQPAPAQQAPFPPRH